MYHKTWEQSVRMGYLLNIYMSVHQDGIFIQISCGLSWKTQAEEVLEKKIVESSRYKKCLCTMWSRLAVWFRLLLGFVYNQSNGARCLSSLQGLQKVSGRTGDENISTLAPWTPYSVLFLWIDSIHPSFILI